MKKAPRSQSVCTSDSIARRMAYGPSSSDESEMYVNAGLGCEKMQLLMSVSVLHQSNLNEEVHCPKSQNVRFLGFDRLLIKFWEGCRYFSSKATKLHSSNRMSPRSI